MNVVYSMQTLTSPFEHWWGTDVSIAGWLVANVNDLSDWIGPVGESLPISTLSFTWLCCSPPLFNFCPEFMLGRFVAGPMSSSSDDELVELLKCITFNYILNNPELYPHHNQKLLGITNNRNYTDTHTILCGKIHCDLLLTYSKNAHRLSFAVLLPLLCSA